MGIIETSSNRNSTSSLIGKFQFLCSLNYRSSCRPNLISAPPGTKRFSPPPTTQISQHINYSLILQYATREANASALIDVHRQKQKREGGRARISFSISFAEECGVVPFSVPGRSLKVVRKDGDMRETRMLIGGGEIDMGDLGDLHGAGEGQAPASFGLRSGKWELSSYQIRRMKHAFSGAYDCLNSTQYTWIPGNNKYIASVSSRYHKSRRSDPRFSSHLHTPITQNATSIFILQKK